MKKVTWRRHHKWFGLILCFFLLMFCLSGIVLNHRRGFAGVDLPRAGLLGGYRYTSWSGGLMRGTHMLSDSTSVVVYGSGGLWLTTPEAGEFRDYNDGLPDGADYRNIRGVVETCDGSLYAVGHWGLYVRRRGDEAWTTVDLPAARDERLTDLTLGADTMVVVSRSYLYTATSPYTQFTRLQLPASPDADGRVTLFRTVWLLHSGELFGRAGQTVVDLVAIVLIVLSVTGLIIWLSPKWGKWRRRRGLPTNAARTTRISLLWHDRLGRTTIVLTLLLCLTGWCLRPPLMIPLAMNRVKPVPGSTLGGRNPWHDQLRMARHDSTAGDWLISTSEGFYSLSALGAEPRALPAAPPVSAMGLNVWQRDAAGRWLCGSFSGLYAWDRTAGSVVDYHSGDTLSADASRSPFGRVSVSGFTSHFAVGPTVVGYADGAPAIPQPEALSRLPMSLWNVALEIHVGRFYIGSLATLLFVFVMGGAAMWCLWTGWKLRKRKVKGA